MLRSQVEEALAELVANGVVVSDSFAGLRALLTPGSRKTQAAARRKHRQPVYEMASAGRWSILHRNNTPPNLNDQALTEEVAWALIKRYGVVFKRLLEREGMALPWRVLLRFYHRLEARGDIRGGRFVAGISGEQFALPEAIGMLACDSSRRCAGEFDLRKRRRSFEPRWHYRSRPAHHGAHQQSHSLPGRRAHRFLRVGRDKLSR